MSMHSPIPRSPATMVIFGITGDLLAKKGIPALHALFQEGVLPDQFRIVAVSRREWSDQQLREYLNDRLSGQASAEFLNLFTFHQGDLSNRETLVTLKEKLRQIDQAAHTSTEKLLYLAIPPEVFVQAIENIIGSNITQVGGDFRLSLEKPYGQSLADVTQVNQLLQKQFKPDQVFRIDHYLAKDSLKNILAFRFSNNLLESSWNRENIEQITVRVWEEIGIASAPYFFDSVGHLQDVGQSHVLQMLAMVTMDRPASYSPSDLSTQRQAVFNALHLPRPANAQRGQFASYRGLESTLANSTTDTYFRIKTELAHERWRGVPIVLESGKKMPFNRKEIVVRFKHPAPCLCKGQHHARNTVRFIIQPEAEQGIKIQFWAKKPGPEWEIEPKDLTFAWQAEQEGLGSLSEYAQLMYDFIRNDQTQFVSAAEAIASWQFISAIQEIWQAPHHPLVMYEDGVAPLGEAK